jgi:hypothetical protein
MLPMPDCIVEVNVDTDGDLDADVVDEESASASSTKHHSKRCAQARSSHSPAKPVNAPANGLRGQRINKVLIQRQCVPFYSKLPA